ncbi:hypothetical protein PALB_21730 [Pseudoalteromonas luteoviolacea B = ATCC 29581]|nr:hypothetical protein PALB_21730 [Pseudoalteromonas luteoviolacea B = ATCC 29581]
MPNDKAYPVGEALRLAFQFENQRQTQKTAKGKPSPTDRINQFASHCQTIKPIL